ncbi:cupin domain-containing protein [Mucilaginibacter sp. HMF5004]|uniref:cupin domain-containing protein n=1 Tax=Mucilaginibacter rivuli TaxID=2857527 RepID=UPI001C602CF8|nr:cupin domain-containing protein [Mucilaginibacter rivuli]MBW4888561.1 cupin domain-containing protein [Mucilaginibacter rivuli]
METQNAAYWIKHLQLQPHPEGGYYKEVFRSAMDVVRTTSQGVKQACTSIYYLLEGEDYSGFHRILSDEIWYFHKGVPLYIHAIDTEGNYVVHELSDTITGNLSVVIEAGQWFAAEIPSADGFVLVSCAVAPAFDFNEFEMAKREELLAKYPRHEGIINKLCRE